MPRIAIVAALDREVSELVKSGKWKLVRRQHDGRQFQFFEHDDWVVLCSGIGAQAARRAAEAVIALYNSDQLYSVGFAGALDASLRVGELFSPSFVLDARDGSRVPLPGADGTLITFMEVAGMEQKIKLAQAYSARAVDMEAAAVAASASAHGIAFGVTKVISDELNFQMPDLSAFIDSEGRFRTAEFVLFAAIRPWLWWRLGILARNTSKAASVLGEHLKVLCSDAGSIVRSNPALAKPTEARR